MNLGSPSYLATAPRVGQVFSLHNEALENAAEKHKTRAGEEEQADDDDQPQVRLEEELNHATSVACGSAHVAVTTDNGAIYTYGSGRLGQLGHGDKKDVDAPRLVEALREHRVINVACGREHTVAATASGQVYFWGNRVDCVGSGSVAMVETLPVPVEGLAGVPIRQIACGAYHTAVLSEDGEVYVWGEYQVDRACARCNQRDPCRVSHLITGRVVSIACGPHQTVAITDDHQVWAWGGGVLKDPTNGHPDIHAFHTPQRIEAFDGYRVVQVACGDFNLVGVTEHGEVVMVRDLDYFKKSHKCVKNTSYGFYQLGGSSDIPLAADDSKAHRYEGSTLSDVRMLQVAVYRNTAMGLTAYGEVFTWTLPDPWTSSKKQADTKPEPAQIDALQGIVATQVACGGEQTAILADETTFLATQLRHALLNDDDKSAAFADLRIVVGQRAILAHKALLLARTRNWRSRLPLFSSASSPPSSPSSASASESAGGFRWVSAGGSGGAQEQEGEQQLDELIFPETAELDGQPRRTVHFTFAVVQGLLQYLYTDKLVPPDELKTRPASHNNKNMKKKKKKNMNKTKVDMKNKSGEDEDEAEEEEDEEEEEEDGAAQRRRWYRNMGDVADYFGIERLQQLCWRATGQSSVNALVQPSSLAFDLYWLVAPQLDALLCPQDHHVDDDGVDNDDDDVDKDADVDVNVDNDVGDVDNDAKDLEQARVETRARLADLKVRVGGTELWAHRFILCCSCDYFRRMFASGMRETELGQVDLESMIEPAVFGHLLGFLYADSLAGVDADMAIELLALADQFMLPRMKRICELRVQKDVDVDNVAYVFHGADMYKAASLRGFCLAFMARSFEQVCRTEPFAALPPALADEVRARAAAYSKTRGPAAPPTSAFSPSSSSSSSSSSAPLLFMTAPPPPAPPAPASSSSSFSRAVRATVHALVAPPPPAPPAPASSSSSSSSSRAVRATEQALVAPPPPSSPSDPSANTRRRHRDGCLLS